jgi:UPF0042 nucleotide-binding protein
VTRASPRVVFLSGLSGSGKSTAMAALEDLAFYCVDNLPVPLIHQFLDLCAKSDPPIGKLALAIDTREPRFLAAMPAVIAQIRERGGEVSVLFLDCANEALVNRYRETRRVHPQAPTGTVEEGIAVERRLLVEMVRLADHVIDTSSLNIHQLKAAIVQYVSGAARPTVVNLVSFGFRYGTPPSAELLFDVRFLANPFFEERLRPLTGENAEVREYVLKAPRSAALRQRLRELLGFLLPLYDAEGKAYLTIGIGCTGGRHRSVVVADALAGELRAGGREVNVEHRDVERGT